MSALFKKLPSSGTIIAVLLVALCWWWISDSPLEVGASPSPSGKVLILLHGHGASKSDLEPLAEQLAEGAPQWTFLLPSGPHRVGLGGRTWYTSVSAKSQAELQEKVAERDLKAREVALELVRELVSDGVPIQHIYVGGFSAGVTVALDVVMNPEGSELGGVVLLSGRANWLKLDPLTDVDRPPLRAFVSHGKADQVVGVGHASQIVAALEEGEHEVVFVEFEGGHEVPEPVIHELVVFLNQV